MQITVRQHYVPRTYLKAWADANDHVRVEDQVSSKQFSTSPENVCVERFYYEADAANPDNEIENLFQPYEASYTSHATTLNAIASSGSSDAQIIANLTAAAADVRLDIAIKNLAAVAYFRTPAALEAMQNELKRDQSDAAQAAAHMTQMPHGMARSALDSTLLKRFQGLVPTYLHTKCRHVTGDRVCFPMQSSPSSGNFGWAIGNDSAMHALMPIGPNLLVMLSMDSIVPQTRAVHLPDEMYEQTSKIVREGTRRFLIL